MISTCQKAGLALCSRTYVPVRSLLFYQIEAIKMPPRNLCWGSALAANGPMVGIVALSITQPHLFDHISFKWASGLLSKIFIEE